MKNYSHNTSAIHYKIKLIIGTIFSLLLMHYGAVAQNKILLVNPAVSATELGNKQTTVSTVDWLTADSAYMSLANAMVAADSSDQIWVKAGVYYPEFDYFLSNNPADPRTKMFRLKNGVKLYGGFTGNETMLTQRNPNTNISLLSGNNLQDADTSNNFYHVLYVENTTPGTEIDGIQIKFGNASSSSDFTNEHFFPVYNNNGGGIYAIGSWLNIINCIIDSNAAGNSGGGIFLSMSDTVHIYNSTISDNYSNYTGGGIKVEDAYADLFLRKIKISRNVAAISHGGAEFAFAPNVYMDSSEISHNYAYLYGGGIFCVNAWLHSKNNLYQYNYTQPAMGSTYLGQGGGAVAYMAYQGEFIHDKFLHNSSGSSGGALNLFAGNRIRVEACYFEGNVCYSSGSAIATGDRNSDTIVNCVFYANIDSSIIGQGGTFSNVSDNVIGGVFAFKSELYNNTFFNNKSVTGVTGIYAEGLLSRQVSFANNIFQNHQAGASDTSFAMYFATVYQSNNIYSNQNVLFRDTTDILGADGIIGTADDGLIPRCDTLIINKGINDSLNLNNIAKDIRGIYRINHSTVDIGAYETNYTDTVSALSTTAGNLICQNSGLIALNATPAGGIISGPGLSGNSFNPINAGTFNFSYVYTDTVYCTDTAFFSLTVDPCLGLNEETAFQGSVFPNPTSGKITIRTIENSGIELFDLKGKRLFSTISISTETKLDLSHLSGGVYLCRISGNNDSHTIKVIIE